MSAPAIGRTPVRAENTRTLYRWDGQPARVPKPGEYYLSGATVTAYKAQKDMVGTFFIAVPVGEGVTPDNLRSDIVTLATLASTLTPESPAHRLRILAARARQLADDADALARRLDTMET